MRVAQKNAHTRKRIFGRTRIVSASSLIASFLFGNTVFAVITSGDTGLQQTAGNAGYNTTGQDVTSYAGAVIQAGLGVIGLIFLIFIIYGGLLWMLAQGEENKISKARNLIFQAIIGIILVLSAYAITNFVVGELIKGSVK